MWLRQLYPCYIHLLVPLPTLVPSPTTENQLFILMFVLLSCSVFLVVVVFILLVLRSRASNFGELSVSYFRLFGGVEFLFFGVVFLCFFGVGFLCFFGVGFLASDFFCNWYYCLKCICLTSDFCVKLASDYNVCLTLYFVCFSASENSAKTSAKISAKNSTKGQCKRPCQKQWQRTAIRSNSTLHGKSVSSLLEYRSK